MRLSEAIRLGAMLKPQAFGDYSVGVGTCALGAAHEALGKNADDESEWWWPELPRDAICPSCGGMRHSDSSFAVGGVIAHLNDVHKWTREQIADWVETIEREQDAKHSQPEPVAVEGV